MPNRDGTGPRGKARKKGGDMKSTRTFVWHVHFYTINRKGEEVFHSHFPETTTREKAIEKSLISARTTRDRVKRLAATRFYKPGGTRRAIKRGVRALKKKLHLRK